ENEPNEEIRQQLIRLNILEVATAYPILLFMYDAYDTGSIGREAFVSGLKALEVYMVRRFLAKESTNYLNKMFPVLSRDIDLEDFDNSLRAALMEKNFPSDLRLRQAAESVTMYNSSRNSRQKVGLIFDQINRSLSAGSGAYTLLDDDPTIEHIMPQTLTEHWKEHIGDQWRDDYELLHTLGNLTLVTQEWNSALSNAAYNTKKAKLAQHGLLLNNSYFSNGPDKWDGDSIRTRAAWLVEKINEIWPVLGELPETAGGWQERPKVLTILGDAYEVKSWRDVVERTAECMVQLCGREFEPKIIAALPSYFAKEPFPHSTRELSNGWWLNVNLSSASVKRVCQIMIEAAGVQEDEYDLELW
ncbi:MAG: HNH endonuclease, partial [Anaerolineales bacterium]|nr:HNH endonuclease [Anaerolineales bacterium]